MKYTRRVELPVCIGGVEWVLEFCPCDPGRRETYYVVELKVGGSDADGDWEGIKYAVLKLRTGVQAESLDDLVRRFLAI